MSLFNYKGSGVFANAYDMMILDEIEREERQEKLRKAYRRSADEDYDLEDDDQYENRHYRLSMGKVER